jgi:ABC-type transport system substrate-binding protein
MPSPAHSRGKTHEHQPLEGLLALLFSFALIAAACGGDDDDSEADGGEDEATTSTTASAGTSGGEEGAGGVSAACGAVGGTATFAMVGGIRHLNGTVQSGYATAVPGTQVNASLLLFDEQYNPQPYLAESWEVADDGLSVTFELRDGATFHDGEPITSEDVAFSLQTSKENHPFSAMFAPVTSVDTPDDLTVVINLEKPHPAILMAMSPGLLPIIPKHIFDDAQDIQTHPRNGGADFVGSGPFKVVEYDARRDHPPRALRRLLHRGCALPGRDHHRPGAGSQHRDPWSG